MTPDTFRHWLSEHGCTFEEHSHERGGGAVGVTVRREGRRAVLPDAASKKDLDPDVVQRIVDELELDPAELPGRRSRV